MATTCSFSPDRRHFFPLNDLLLGDSRPICLDLHFSLDKHLTVFAFKVGIYFKWNFIQFNPIKSNSLKLNFNFFLIFKLIEIYFWPFLCDRTVASAGHLPEYPAGQRQRSDWDGAPRSGRPWSPRVPAFRRVSRQVKSSIFQIIYRKKHFNNLI